VPGFPAPLLKFREDDNNGFPLAGGKLYSYVAGTNTPQATYSDPDLAAGHQNTNPVILDAAGRANVFVQDGVGYKYVLTDALNNTIWTVDNVIVPVSGVIQAPPSGGGGPPPPVTPTVVYPMPCGAIVLWGALAAPADVVTGTSPPQAVWLLCDGSPVSSTVYGDLYAAIGTSYGNGNGSTTFNVPDLRERFPLGKSASGANATLGHISGAIQHTHHGPSHTHATEPHRHGHIHTHTIPHVGWSVQVFTQPNVQANALQAGAGATTNESNVTQTIADLATSDANPNYTDQQWVVTDADGTQATDGADPPYQVVNYLIKTTKN
jgi:microcystin-dependent protein